MASSSTTSSLASQPCKYDVFLNFRGEDTRRNFTSHLNAALSQMDLQIFIDDDELKRGEQIPQSLPQAIEDSTVAVLVFSKNYAHSTWCLDELAKIIECHETHGQIVIPVFYEIDPSHLKKQSHNVAAALVKHEQNPKNTHKIQRWRDALTIASNLRGFDSKDFRNDHMLINKIVEDILEKLNQSMTWDGFENLVGMESRIEKIKKAFTIKPLQVCLLGIWGMGGGGKTTIAEVIYNMMSYQFQGCCFVHNVRQQTEAGNLIKLQEELVSKVLGEKNLVKYMFSAGPRPFLKTRLGRKKMLIVLDDVDDPLQIESLIGDPCWFRSESMILITSRNKQVFEGRADFIYKAELLNDDEAFQLFMKSAFKQKYPRDDYASLSNSMINYAQGNPLALKVLGSSLIGKKKKEWESVLDQLSKVLDKNIQSVLQISYNGLNKMEKDVFLDIACFFKCDKADVVKGVLESCGFAADILINGLVDKCLVTICGDRLIMHDLLQEMGKEIVCQEAKYPSQRSRLWDPKDIYEVFAENKAAEAVESIILDVSKIREIDLNSRVFMKMPNLKFIKFYKRYNKNSNLHLSYGLDFFPNKIRYLCWEEYPLESFPSSFQPENLVVLELPNSKIKQLWKGAKEDSVTSQMTYGAIGLIVNGFWSLVKVPSYICGNQLGNLCSLSFVNNKSITHLPDRRSGFLETLEVLDLRGCSNLSTFPEISSNIKELNLTWTAIKHMPSSSVELLSKLKKLEMRYCRKLESLPNNFFSKLTSLEKLDLGGSSCFKELPEILQPIDNLESLELNETAIEKLSSSIGNLKGLKDLNMFGCRRLVYFPKSSINSGCVNLSNCKLRRLPEDLSFLSSVKSLDFSRNNFERIPATINQLSRLKYLHINNCERLQSLPELPSSVSLLEATGCISLEQIWTLKQLSLDLQEHWIIFDLSDCLKLDEDECQAAANAQLRNHITAFTRNQMQKSLDHFIMIYPGNRIPEWVKYQSMGNYVQIHLPSLWFNHQFLGFAFYFCANFVDYEDEGAGNYRCDCYLGDNYHWYIDGSVLESFHIPRADKEHMIVWISDDFCEWIRKHGNSEEDVVFFKFTNSAKNIVTKCGVIPLYAQKDEDDFCETFDFPTLGKSKIKRSGTSAGSFHCRPKKRRNME